MNRETAARRIQAAFRSGRKPNTTQFVNKFPEFDYALTKPTITSTILAIKDVPFIDLSEEPLPAGVSELLGYTSTGKKPVVRKIRGRNAILGANKTNTMDVKRWAFTINFKNPDSKAYVSYSDKERLQINTTGPYERVLRFLHKTYLPGVWGAPVKIVKIDTKMYINRQFNMPSFGDELSRRVPKSKLLSWRDEPELGPGTFLKWGDPRATLVFFTNGTILTLGLKSFDDVNVTSKILKEIFSKYLVDKTRVFKYARGGNYTGIAEPPKPARKNLAAKRARAAGRYQMAYGWNNTLAGHYVRPGANGKPRFYPLVANLKLVRPKVIRAYAEAGVAIPPGVRNALGIEAGAAPVAKVEGRRAPNWSATKNGYYVKPGPGGQPYFYKVPKGKAAAKKTVVAAYRAAGINIPAPVRNLFGIAGNNAGSAPTGKQHYVNYNAQGGLRINGKQFSRFTQAELVQIARNLNIPQVNASTRLANIARYIKNAVGNVNNGVDATLNGTQIVFMNNGRVKRGGRARQWATLKVAEQNSLARAFLANDEYEQYAKLAKANKYQYITGMKKQRRAQQLQSARANANEAAVSSASSSINANFAKNLEMEMEVRALLGNNANNANVNKFKAIMMALPSGSRGKPLAANVKKALKEFQRTKMYGAQLANVKRNYEAAITVPNWLPANLRANYKKTLLNLATEPNAKGKLPNKAAVKRGIKGWLDQRLPQKARAAYEKENMMTGNIIQVPAWNPNNRKSPNVPNVKVRRLGPERVRKPKPKPNAGTGPHTGPVKKAVKDPRENRNYPVPRNANAENLVNAIAELGLPIGPSNRYSWTYLAKKGLNNRFYQNWANFTASPNAPLTVNTAKAKLNSMKTAKARHEWTVAHRNKFSKENYAKILEHRRALENRNKARRAAKREA